VAIDPVVTKLPQKGKTRRPKTPKKRERKRGNQPMERLMEMPHPPLNLSRPNRRWKGNRLTQLNKHQPG
jgi:hypothetical protein